MDSVLYCVYAAESVITWAEVVLMLSVGGAGLNGGIIHVYC